MSADNGIYIAEFDDGFRVTHAGAIDNLDYYPEGSRERKETQYRYFKRSPVFKTRSEALEEASKIHDDIMNSEFPILEYGICLLGHMGKWIAPQHNSLTVPPQECEVARMTLGGKLTIMKQSDDTK